MCRFLSSGFKLKTQNKGRDTDEIHESRTSTLSCLRLFLNILMEAAALFGLAYLSLDWMASRAAGRYTSEYIELSFEPCDAFRTDCPRT